MTELGANEVINYRSEDVFRRAKAIAGDRGIDTIIDDIGPSNGVDNLGLLGPEGGLACIAGIPDLSVLPDLAYSISIHDIGLGGVLATPTFRRGKKMARMATELMTLVEVEKITPTVVEQTTLEAIPKALHRLAEGHVRGKIVPDCKADFGSEWDTRSSPERLLPWVSAQLSDETSCRLNEALYRHFVARKRSSQTFWTE